MVASRSGRPSCGKAWVGCRPRQLLLAGMGFMLVLQLRTSLYLRELEYSAVSGGALMRGIKQRFRRNLAILGGQDVLALQAEAAANGLANDDLARERATTFSGADALATSSSGSDGQAVTTSRDTSPGDDGMEVSLFTEPLAITPSGNLPITAGSGRSSSDSRSDRSSGGSSVSSSSSSSSVSSSSSGGGSSSTSSGSSISSSSSVGELNSWETSQATSAAADSAALSRGSSQQQPPQLPVLASSDAQALSDALGGNVRVESRLAALPTWLADPEAFKGPTGALQGGSMRSAGPPCLVLRGIRAQKVVLTTDAPTRVIPLEKGATNHGCVVPSGGQAPTPYGVAPLVTYLLTFKDHYRETENCLASLMRYAHEASSAEFLLVDDGSTAPGGAKLFRFVDDLKSVLGADVRLLRHPKSLGYLAAVTDASKLARGDFLLILNNDLRLHRYCVANLLATFQTHANVGLVAPRFQDEAGKLLESGGLIFNDAKGWSYGRGETARDQHSLAPYSSVRESDYGSAACVLLPRALFLALDLYDRYFLPAYYEDTDMAFQIRQRAGLRVLVQPYARVTHAESTTYGGKGKERAKEKLMEHGQAKFYNKWKQALTFHGASKINRAPQNEKWLRDHNDVFDHATRHYSSRVLFLALATDFASTSPTALARRDKAGAGADGGDASTSNLFLPPRLAGQLRVLLATRAHVTIVFANRNADPATAARLRWLGCTVIPLNELVVSQRYAAVSPCRFDLVFAHTLAAYSAVRPLLKEACPSVPPPPPPKNKKKKNGGFFSSSGSGDDYDPSSVVLTPHVIDVGADSAFHPSVGGTTPSDRAALGSATALLVASAEHKAAILRLIPEFAGRTNGGGGGGTSGRRPNDVIVLPSASLAAVGSAVAGSGGGSRGLVGNQAADSSYRAISLAGAAAAASADAAAAADAGSPSTSSAKTTDERFDQRYGIVVAADLSEPEVAAAVADFCQRTVQLLAASLRASSSSSSSTPSLLTDDALVVHVVPLPSATGSSSNSGSSGSRRSSGSYDLPPVLVRLNGTSGSPGSSASSSSSSSMSGSSRGSSSSASSSSSSSNSNSGRVEIRLHELSTTIRPHSSSSGGSNSGSAGGGSALLAAVLAAARLHVVCTPVAWLRSGSMDLHVHEAMLAGVPTVTTAAAATRLKEIGAPLVVDGPSANVAASAGSAAALAAEIAALYQDPVRWKRLVDSGYQTMGSNGALQLRATVGALASALRRATKTDRAYPAPSGSSTGSRNNGNPKKGAWILPPPPRLVGRLKQYAAMQAEAARSRVLHGAQW